MNLALNALLLNREIIDAASDKSNESKVLNGIYDIAFKTSLFDMDLDSTATLKTLELITDDPPVLWLYAYKYPTACAFLRRLVDPTDYSGQVVDDRYTHHPKKVQILNGKKVILANLVSAAGEYIPIDFPLQTLSAPAGQAIALRMAYMAAPLIVGKGAKSLRETIKTDYVVAKAEAQRLDSLESFSFQEESNMSEFVKERLS